MKNIIKITLFFITTFIFSLSLAFGETPEEKGLRLAIEADLTGEGFIDTVSTSQMTLRNAQGEESIREFSSKTLEVENDGDKSIFIFHHPKDVKGTATLTFTHKTGPDDQWLYLPALKRVKRIASKNKSGPFLGSEFSFEDFSFQEVEKYKYLFLREENYLNKPCFVVERIPLDPYSGYTKQIVWIDKKNYLVQKIHHYDRKFFHLKTQLFKDYRIYEGFFWQPHEIEMINHQNGKKSVLYFDEVKIKNGFTERDFSQNSLKRSR